MLTSLLSADLKPYAPFFSHLGLPFWPGGLTLLAAAPGTGKTSWLLQAAAEAAAHRFPAAVVCYEHSPDELSFRLLEQAKADLWGAHSGDGETLSAELLGVFLPRTRVALIQVGDQDTVRAIRQALVESHGFVPGQPAFLAVDYLQRIPVLDATGLVREEIRAGEAAAALRSLARETGWAVLAAAAIRAGAFTRSSPPDLSVLLGDERVAYEPDRVVFLKRDRVLPCGCCANLTAHVLKDRTAPQRHLLLTFWGQRFTLLLRDSHE